MTHGQLDLLAEYRQVTITDWFGAGRSEHREWYACLECGLFSIENDFGRIWLRCAPCMAVSDDHVFEEFRYKHCFNRWTKFEPLDLPWIRAARTAS